MKTEEVKNFLQTFDCQMEQVLDLCDCSKLNFIQELIFKLDDNSNLNIIL